MKLNKPTVGDSVNINVDKFTKSANPESSILLAFCFSLISALNPPYLAEGGGRFKLRGFTGTNINAAKKSAYISKMIMETDENMSFASILSSLLQYIYTEDAVTKLNSGNYVSPNYWTAANKTNTKYDDNPVVIKEAKDTYNDQTIEIEDPSTTGLPFKYDYF